VERALYVAVVGEKQQVRAGEVELVKGALVDGEGRTKFSGPAAQVAGPQQLPAGARFRLAVAQHQLGVVQRLPRAHQHRARRVAHHIGWHVARRHVQAHVRVDTVDVGRARRHEHRLVPGRLAA